MGYTNTEAGYFYWHCTVAAILIEQLEKRNAATNSHVQRAVRMATETARGKRGVQYASRSANERRTLSQGAWAGLGLTKEHVVPVSVITRRIIDEYDSGRKYAWSDILDVFTQHDLENWGVVDSDSFHSEVAPLSAIIASIVRRSAVLAWITKDEDTLLKKRGLTKTMPVGAEDDDLARYKACGIELIRLSSEPRT